MAPVKLAPSILAADLSRLGEQVQAAALAGADYMHVDPMDGQFVPNLTFGPLIVDAVRRSTSVPIDVHMMVESPERHIGAMKDAGTEIFTVHAEACRHLHRVVHLVREAGMRPGVAINPATPLSQVQWVLPDIDLLLVMSINPGWGGQSFLPLALAKLREARSLIDALGLEVELEVDGGVDETTAPLAVQSGATMLVAGTAVFGQADGIDAAIRRFRQAVASVEYRAG